MTRDGILKLLVRFKVLIDRQRNYVAILNFIMLLYLFIDKIGFHWWFLLAIPLLIVWSFIDMKYILPRETNYLHSKSDFLRRLLK
jgi:hypothetical protein